MLAAETVRLVEMGDGYARQMLNQGPSQFAGRFFDSHFPGHVDISVITSKIRSSELI